MNGLFRAARQVQEFCDAQLRPLAEVKEQPQMMEALARLRLL